MKHAPDTLDGIATLAGEGVASEPAETSSEARSEFLSNGDKLGRYVVLRMLGAGAMGAVYLAYDPELDRKVALKQLHRGTDPNKRKGLLREAQAMAKLTHTNPRSATSSAIFQMLRPIRICGVRSCSKTTVSGDAPADRRGAGRPTMSAHLRAYGVRRATSEPGGSGALSIAPTDGKSRDSRATTPSRVCSSECSSGGSAAE